MKWWGIGRTRKNNFSFPFPSRPFPSFVLTRLPLQLDTKSEEYFWSPLGRPSRLLPYSDVLTRVNPSQRVNSLRRYGGTRSQYPTPDGMFPPYRTRSSERSPLSEGLLRLSTPSTRRCKGRQPPHSGSKASQKPPRSVGDGADMMVHRPREILWERTSTVVKTMKTRRRQRESPSKLILC